MPFTVAIENTRSDAEGETLNIGHKLRDRKDNTHPSLPNPKSLFPSLTLSPSPRSIDR